jgi:hypothetical protein
VRLTNTATTKWRKRRKTWREWGAAGRTKRVMALMSKGMFSKAGRMMQSKGVGNMEDEGVRQQMEDKHPDRAYELPGELPEEVKDLVLKVDKGELLEAYRNLKYMVGTGSGDNRNEYLLALMAVKGRQADKALDGHHKFVQRFVNAELPGWYYGVSGMVKVVPLVKVAPEQVGGTPDVRPIGMGCVRHRVWGRVVMGAQREMFEATMWTTQVACGVKAGLQKLVFGVTTHMQLHQGHCLLKLDFSNAFNSVWRARVLQSIMRKKEWRHLYKYFWATLSPAAVIAGLTSRSAGVVQGSAGGPAGFCMAIQEFLEKADKELRTMGGMAVFDMDDGYLVGRVKDVLEVVEELEVQLKTRAGCSLNQVKSYVYANDMGRVEAALKAKVGLEFKLGMLDPVEWDLGMAARGLGAGGLDGMEVPMGVMVSGVPVGDAEYVACKMACKVSEAVSEIQQTILSLRHVSAQNLFALTAYCLSTKMQYWMQVMPVEVLRPHLARFDAAILEAVGVATAQEWRTGVIGSPTSMGEVAKARLRMPKRMGGGVIRSAMSTADAAYVGGICLAMPAMTTRTMDQGKVVLGLLRHDEDKIGKGMFDAVGDHTGRFSTLIEGGTTVGVELGQAYRRLQRQVLGEEGVVEDLQETSFFVMGAEGAGVSARNKVWDKPQHEIALAVDDRLEMDLEDRLVHVYDV